MNPFRLLAAKLTALWGEPPTAKRATVALSYEPAAMSPTLTVATIQSALRSAEQGQTRNLFAIYRDLMAGGSHVQAELSKRKMSLLGQPMSIQPADKNRPDDLRAVEAVQRLIADCENWTDGCLHLMDSCLWPLTVCEKIFEPAQRSEASLSLRYTLRRFEPVNPTLFCFEERYRSTPDPLALEWEPNLRFWVTDADGRISYDITQAYRPDPARHIVHRGHMLTSMRDNWGGPMRAVLFWIYLVLLLRDWWGRFSERYGSPFVVGRTDIGNAESVTLLETAFSNSTKIGGLVVDHDTQVELKEAAVSGAADNFARFLEICHREISKLIVGQTLSSESAPTGLGSGTAQLHGEVREDLTCFDQVKLNETLQRQLFAQFLAINGLRGQPPRLVWGAESAEDAKATADLLVGLNNAGLEPTDEALPTLSERIGFPLQRKQALLPPSPLNGERAGVRGETMQSAKQDSEDSDDEDADDSTEDETLSAFIPQAPPNPVDAIASARAKALGQVYRGSMAPFRQIILQSTSEQECLAKLRAAYADWKPDRLASEMETALQICAAAGAAAAAPR